MSDRSYSPRVPAHEPSEPPQFAIFQVTSHSSEAAAQAGPSPGLGLSRPEGPA
ncbi:hypothetical protein K466DRAFT_590023 [Polyporus arcularius HHB13444]|uniref:Uncharacterized protein n=1 Tax=Polyporus arcularius HHB13444 TaxID=1314778 RepID=A0A5C3NKL0_9APHY|nr:hypothetical protein K466DRAFT_592931 [Polyporus arcularius HHB13444]TFK79686.1 hypothetical protein K466DRAFT_592263 [Polyporus arcularius HHB13444]TFK81193.1 hypothetical protein K466DRAFT_591412 [Polyporus arcularius HHB13444]TFK83072.1 hypothetical protein K466DRAFT_590023 [Polyporus arcularius HHB13444]